MSNDNQNQIAPFFKKSADSTSPFTSSLKNLLNQIEKYLDRYPGIIEFINNAKISKDNTEHKGQTLDIRTLAIEDLQNALILALLPYLSDKEDAESIAESISERAIDIYHELNRYKQQADDETTSWEQSKNELSERILDLKSSPASKQTIAIGQCIAVLTHFARNSEDYKSALADSAKVLQAHQWALAHLTPILDDPKTTAFKASLEESIRNLTEYLAQVYEQIQEGMLNDEDPAATPEGRKEPGHVTENAAKSSQKGTSKAMTTTNNKTSGSKSSAESQEPQPLKLDKLLEEYAENLTSHAQDEGKQNLSGREDVVREMIVSLSKRDNPNVILSGEKGVGKSEILNALAVSINSGQGPERLKSTSIIELNIAKMAALTGAGQRQGQAGEGYMLTDMLRYNFAEILQQMGDKNVARIHYVLKLNARDFIGTSEKINNMGGILLSEIEKVGSVPVIIEADNSDLKKIQSQNPALLEKFDIVRAKEPDPAKLLELVSEKARDMEKAHGGAHASQDTLHRLVQLSNEHGKDIAQPGWALSLLDGAVARAEAEGAQEVSEDHVIQQLARSINLPEHFVGTQTSERVATLRNYLPSVIFGQDEAVDTLSGHLESYELRDPDKPLGVICLVGPTGVGKTELSIQTANHLFDAVDIHGREQAVIRVDMNTFSERASTSQITGASPNYIGYGEPTALEGIEERPNSVILLDEFEKAHPDVQKTLMNVFDTGYMTLKNGKTLDFTNAIFILTSNLGAREAEEAEEKGQIGFVRSEGNEERGRKAALEARKKHMLPEIRNRITFVEMNSLDHDTALKITQSKIAKVAKRLQSHFGNIQLKVEKRAEEVIHSTYDKKSGGRSVDRSVQEKLVAPLSRWLLKPENKKALSEAPEGSVLRIRNLKKEFNPVLELPKATKNPAAPTSHPAP